MSKKNRIGSIPALRDEGSSFVCIDPKGENAAVCAAALIRQGVNVLQFNPFDILAEALDEANAPFRKMKRLKRATAGLVSAKDLKKRGWA